MLPCAFPGQTHQLARAFRVKYDHKYRAQGYKELELCGLKKGEPYGEGWGGGLVGVTWLRNM
jgi:hypothetical protein